MESKCHKLFRQKFISFQNIFIIHIIYIYAYRSFSYILDNSLRGPQKKKGEIEKYKLNEMGALNIK